MATLLLRLRRRRASRRLPPYRTLRCRMVGHQVTWCRRLCTPVAGRGICGRPALHGLLGKTQLAIQEKLRQDGVAG
ncbi:MAG: hypothetical protein HY812_02695 [Planctomycetes bacterium]|nr:hypothetical protein [Planctomycetota bacterium]